MPEQICRAAQRGEGRRSVNDSGAIVAAVGYAYSRLGRFVESEATLARA